MRTIALALAPLLVTSLASAEVSRLPDAALNKQVTSRVKRKLLRPLARRDARRSRFSRVVQPSTERRVRVLARGTDREGAAFVSFAIDEKRGVWRRKWRNSRWLGCVYPRSGKIFVKRGKRFFAHTILIGKRSRPRPAGTCTPAASAQAVAKR